MKKFFSLNLLIRLIIILIFIFGFTQSAHAYLDPGTGSLLLQGIIAGIVTAGVVVKIYWHRFLKVLGFRKDVDKDEN